MDEKKQKVGLFGLEKLSNWLDKKGREVKGKKWFILCKSFHWLIKCGLNLVQLTFSKLLI